MDGYEIYGGFSDLLGKHKEVTKVLMGIGLAVIIGFIVLVLLIAVMWLFGVGRYDPEDFANPYYYDRNARWWYYTQRNPFKYYWRNVRRYRNNWYNPYYFGGYY